MHKPDGVIEHEVRRELETDPAVDARGIVVSVEDGRVTIRGSVPRAEDVLDATEDAWRVHGVTAVDNELLVTPDCEPQHIDPLP